MNETLTPPQVAKQLGVNADKILAWIRSGELTAINVAQNLGGRPRYRVTSQDLEQFQDSRRTRKPVRTVQSQLSGKTYY